MTVETVLGTSVAVFVGLIVVLFGAAAWMTGRALAVTWKPFWLTVLYSVLLAVGARFLTYALFEGELLSLSGYVLAAAVLLGAMLIAYRFYRARQMVQQYPWIYERYGPFAWREKHRPAS